MTKKGEVPASKIGSRWRFDHNEIDAWVKNQNLSMITVISIMTEHHSHFLFDTGDSKEQLLTVL